MDKQERREFTRTIRRQQLKQIVPLADSTVPRQHQWHRFEVVI